MEFFTSLLSSQPATVPLGGLVTLFFLLFFTGKVKPESAVKEAREDRDARVAEAKATADARIADKDAHHKTVVADKDRQIEQWRTAYLNDEETISELLSHLAEMKELSRTGVHLLGALPQPSEESGT